MKRSVIFFVAVIIIIFTACVQPPVAKEYACKEYSLECELAKDHVLILPRQYDSKTLDVFGNHLSDGVQNQWYLLTPRTQSLVPVQVQTCIGYLPGEAGGPVYTYNPSVAEVLGKMNEWKEHIVLDSGDLTRVIGGLAKAVVMISGPNEIIVGTQMSAEIAFPRKE